jgi:hypothetical protein
MFEEFPKSLMDKKFPTILSLLVSSVNKAVQDFKKLEEDAIDTTNFEDSAWQLTYSILIALEKIFQVKQQELHSDQLKVCNSLRISSSKNQDLTD